MSATTSTLAPSVESDAEFRTFCTGISDKLAAMGLIKETVAGEINLATVTKPNGDPMMGEPEWKGFQIWRPNDALQSTAPFFLRLEYGGSQSMMGPPEVGSPALKFTFGTSHAAGVLGAQKTAEKYLSFVGSQSAQKCAWSGDANRFGCALFYDHSGCIWLSFERTYGADGNDTGDGLIIAGGQGTYNKFQVVLPSAGGVPAWETDYGCIAPTQGTGVRGTEVALYRLTPFLGRALRPMRSCFAYFNADVTAESVVTASVDGNNHALFCVGNSTTQIGRGNNNTRLALRYE
jgi:hypothetical protein